MAKLILAVTQAYKIYKRQFMFVYVSSRRFQHINVSKLKMYVKVIIYNLENLGQGHEVEH